MINYDNKTFRSVNNTDNGEVNAETIFHYRQAGNIVTAVYSGGAIVSGHLVALVNDKGELDMRYHHINKEGSLMTGYCKSIPEMLPNGKIRLHESWTWTSGNLTSGESIIEEV